VKRILLIGAAGQVGWELRQTLAPLGELIVTGREQVDLADQNCIQQFIRDSKPNLLVNAAAYTAVDQAEIEPELANSINAIAPTVMAEEAQRLGAALFHISTDYVFDGSKNVPYLEQDDPAPLNVYGRSKLAGENGVRQSCDRHWIIRTAWVYGTYGKGNFVKTMLRLGSEREELRVVADQVGSPTWTRDIAQAIAQLALQADAESATESSGFGTYHFTNSGVASWYDFAVAIFEEAQLIGYPLKIQRVVPITTSEYPTPACRPVYSVLSPKKIATALGEYPMHWRQQLRKMLVELYSQTHESTYSLRR